MGRAAVVTPLYISFAWILMISYQLFTQIAVTTVITYVDELWPLAGGWLTSRMEMIVFIYAFSWVFLLSSAIPSFILGKEKGVLAQFLVCLAVTFLAFVVQDILTTYSGGPVHQLFNLAVLFQNPILAVGYLLIPYALMAFLDFRSRKKRKKEEEKEKLKEETASNLQEDVSRTSHIGTSRSSKPPPTDSST